MPISFPQSDRQPAKLGRPTSVACSFRNFSWEELSQKWLAAIKSDVIHNPDSMTKHCVYALETGTRMSGYTLSEDRTRAILAFRQYEVVGWLFMPYVVDHKEYLLNFFVREAFRKQGIGTALNEKVQQAIPGERFYQVWPTREHGVM